MPEPEFNVSLFDKALHDRSAFSCGITAIDTWLAESVSKQIKEDRLRLWCATDQEGVLVGFYGLNAHSVKPKQAGNLALKNERHEIPALYLPCMAVSSAYQGRGVGTALMGHAIENAVDIADKTAAAAIILDVHKDAQYERRMAFYTRIGFVPLGGEAEERLFLSMKVARKSLKAVDERAATYAAP